MNTKRASLVSAIFLGFSVGALAQQPSAKPAAKPIDPQKAALIEEMLALTKPERSMDQAVQQLKTAFSAGAENRFKAQISQMGDDPNKYQPELKRFEDKFFQLISQRLSWKTMKPKFVSLYDETFTKQELADTVAFYKTPSGQSLLVKTPQLTAKSMQFGRDQMGGAMDDVRKLNEEFMAEVKKKHDSGAKKK